MGLKRGMTNNRSGRPKGSPNKSSEQLRNIFQQFLEANLESMQRDFDQLEAKDRLMFLERIAKMIIPAPITLENLNDAALDALLDRLKNDTGQPASITIDHDDVDL